MAAHGIKASLRFLVFVKNEGEWEMVAEMLNHLDAARFARMISDSDETVAYVENRFTGYMLDMYENGFRKG